MEAHGTPTGTGPLTIEEFERLPEDEHRHDLVRGRLVREPPAGFEHGELGMEIGRALANFVRRRRLGRVVTAETGFVLAEDPPTVRAPDVAFVAEARLPPAGSRGGFLRLAPDLAVEVVSPSNTWADVAAKVRDYLDGGTRLVWILEPRSRSVTVHRPGEAPRVVGEDEVLEGGEVLPGFRLRVGKLFRG